MRNAELELLESGSEAIRTAGSLGTRRVEWSRGWSVLTLRDGDLRKIVSKRKNETQSPIPNDALRIVPLRAPTPRPGLHPASTNAAPAHNSRGHYSEYRFFAQARNDA